MKSLSDFRARIDAIDDELIILLKERFEIVQKVGHHKAQNHLEVVQSDRVNDVLTRVRELAIKYNLDPEFIVGLYERMIDHAHVLEGGIRKKYETTKL